jgi:predicted metal-dependent peptidase
VIREILIRLRARAGVRVHLIGCDVRARYAGVLHAERQLEDLELPRGGGTDLRVGIELGRRLPLDCMLILTDGITPWPERPPGFPVIIALMGPPKWSVPAWAATVVVEDAP